MKSFLQRQKKNLVLGSMLASASINTCFADSITGNGDLDTVLGFLNDGTENLKKGGLYIIGVLIVIAVIFFGARWLFNMWRSWMSRAQ